MRYRLLYLVADRFPEAFWHVLPYSWRTWWANEWVRRYMEETRR